MNNQPNKRDVFSDFENDLKSGKRNPILLIGIGIFGWTAIGSIAYLIKTVLKDVFLISGIVPEVNIVFNEIVDFAIIIIGSLYLFRIVKLHKYSYTQIFKYSIFFLILSQVLQMIQPLIISEIKNNLYLENSSEYYQFLSENPEYYYINIVSSVVVWIIIIYIILNEKEIKLS